MATSSAASGISGLGGSASGGGLPWDLLLEVGGGLLSSWFESNSANKAADTQSAGYSAAIAEQKRQFDQMMRLMAPAVASENARRGVADAFLGVPQGSNPLTSGGAGATGGSYSPGAWGATNGTGNGGSPGTARAIGSGLGAAAGSFFGPIGTSVGGALGGMAGGLFNDKPGWKERGARLATGAPNIDPALYDEYFNSQPAFASEWAKPDVQQLFGGDRDAYLWWHANGGFTDGKQSWAPQQEWLNRANASAASGGLPATGAGGGGTATGTGTTGTTNPLTQQSALDIWKASPFYTAAKSGFDTDRKFIEGGSAAGGKLLSGSTLKALDDRGAARANDSAQQFYTALTGGTPSTNVTNLSNAGMSYANNLTNPLINRANVQAQGNLAGNNAWMKAFQGAAGALGDYGKQNGWF